MKRGVSQHNLFPSTIITKSFHDRVISIQVQKNKFSTAHVVSFFTIQNIILNNPEISKVKVHNVPSIMRGRYPLRVH